jgi:hypothetical protein
MNYREPYVFPEVKKPKTTTKKDIIGLLVGGFIQMVLYFGCLVTMKLLDQSKLFAMIVSSVISLFGVSCYHYWRFKIKFPNAYN